jgi:hypothetical protein
MVDRIFYENLAIIGIRFAPLTFVLSPRWREREG